MKRDNRKELYKLPLEVRVNWAGAESFRDEEGFRRVLGGYRKKGRTCGRCGIGIAESPDAKWCHVCVNLSDAKVRHLNNIHAYHNEGVPESIKCPRCGLGVDNDRDGDCAICHHLTNEQVAAMQLHDTLEKIEFRWEGDNRGMDDTPKSGQAESKGKPSLLRQPVKLRTVGRMVGTFEEAQLLSGAVLSEFDEGVLHSYGVAWGNDDR